MERNLTPEEARKELINLVRQGRTIADALKVIGRSRSWYDTQRREAEGFAAYIDNARLRTSDLADEARSGLNDFASFSEKYLGARFGTICSMWSICWKVRNLVGYIQR